MNANASKKISAVGLGLASAFGALVFVAGCSSENGSEDPALTSGVTETESLTAAEAAIRSACPADTHADAIIDGIPAFARCKNANGTYHDTNIYSDDGVHTSATQKSSAWLETEGGHGYQCTELASRYMHFQFGVPTHWGIDVAEQMCDVTVAGVEHTSSPMHGDLIVLPGSAGHVAVIDDVTSTHVTVVQQNVAGEPTGTYARSSAKCFLHATANSTACLNVKNGEYCGQSAAFPHGKEGTLYTCKNHFLSDRVTCGTGCIVVSGGNDKCHVAKQAFDAPSDDESTDTDGL